MLLLAQSRIMLLAGTFTNVVVGYGLTVLTQMLVFFSFGLHTTLAQNDE